MVHFRQVNSKPLSAIGSPHTLQVLAWSACTTGKIFVDRPQGDTLGMSSEVDSFKFLTIAEGVNEARVAIEEFCGSLPFDDLRRVDIGGEVKFSFFISCHFSFFFKPSGCLVRLFIRSV